MGLAMANNLQRHLAAKNIPGMVYSNRTMARGSPLQALGGVPEKSFENVVGQCGIIFTMVLSFCYPFPPWKKMDDKLIEIDLQRHRPQQSHLNGPEIRAIPPRQDLRGLFHRPPPNRGFDRLQASRATGVVSRGAGLWRTPDCRGWEVGVCDWRA